MITVLEGPDFAGKTTYAEQQGCRVLHSGPPPVFHYKIDCFDYYEEQVLALDPREDVVFDRLWVGELIYGPIYRGRSQLSFSDHEVMTELCARIGARLLYFDTSERVLRERFHGARGDDMVKEEDTLMRISAQYRALLGTDSRWERVVTS